MNRLIAVLVLSSLADLALTIRCYDCTSQLTYFEYDACYHGNERYLKSIECSEPSVCAVYHYQTEVPGSYARWSVTRGCQALRYGATCEDIFTDLRKTGSVLPGQHICTTCSDDLCNLATGLEVSRWIFLSPIVFCFVFFNFS